MILSSKSELSQGEVVSLLDLLFGSELLLSLGECSSDGSGSLESQVNGVVFLALKSFSNSFSVSLVDDSQVFSDGLSDNSDFAELSGGTTSNLESSEVVEFLLVFFQTLEQFIIASVSKLEDSELLVSHFSPLLTCECGRD